MPYLRVARSFQLLLCLLIFCVGLSVSSQTDDELVYGVQTMTDAVSDGYVFFAPIAGRTVYLIDNQGRLVNQWDSEYYTLSAYLLDNGHVLIAVMLEFSAGETGRLEEYDWDGNLVWSYTLPDMHHDIEPMPNGHILVSVWERIPPDDALALGLNHDLLPGVVLSNSPQPDERLWFDRILEIDPATDSIVWQWSSSDHFIQNYDESLPNYGNPADYPRRIDINFTALGQPNDRTHVNAIDYHPQLDQILISVPAYGEIWIIDHSISTAEAAGEAGDLLYRWGNPMAYGRGTRAERQLFLQHDSHWLDNGTIMVFNNGVPLVRGYSTVDEIVPPLQADGRYPIDVDSPFAPDAPVWRYPTDEDDSFYSRGLSSAQRLPNNHTFITSGFNGRIFEIDEAGEIVWDYLSPVFSYPNALARSPIFRAYRILPDHPALADRDLTPGETLPLITTLPQ